MPQVPSFTYAVERHDLTLLVVEAAHRGVRRVARVFEQHELVGQQLRLVEHHFGAGLVELVDHLGRDGELA